MFFFGNLEIAELFRAIRYIEISAIAESREVAHQQQNPANYMYVADIPNISPYGPDTRLRAKFYTGP